MTLAVENILRTFEIHIRNRIYGPIHEKNGRRIRMNNEIDQMIVGKDIV